MVARTISQSRPALRGVRPFDPTRDLVAVARLLEEAFRTESTFPFAHTPLLREIGILLWTLSYVPVFPENISGFVWVEDGKVVGNVTVGLDEGRLDRVIISNVAVKPEHRRQGIARQLMLAALNELRAHAVKWALLNVRPTNPGAIKLYADLGFQEIEMRGEWSRTSFFPEVKRARELGVEEIRLRPLRSTDQRAASELIRAATPANVQALRGKWFDAFDLNWEDRVTEIVTDFLTAQETRRWVLERNGKLDALMTMHAQRIATPHRLSLQVHPDARGRVEGELVALALRELARFPTREIRAVASGTHPESIAALEQHGFRFWNGLTLMALEL